MFARRSENVPSCKAILGQIAKNEGLERGSEEAKQKSVLEAEEPNKGFGDIKPKGNLRAKKAKSNLKTKAVKDISKKNLIQKIR